MNITELVILVFMEIGKHPQRIAMLELLRDIADREIRRAKIEKEG